MRRLPRDQQSRDLPIADPDEELWAKVRTPESAET